MGCPPARPCSRKSVFCGDRARGSCAQLSITTKDLFDPQLFDLGVGQGFETSQEFVGQACTRRRVERQGRAPEFFDRHRYLHRPTVNSSAGYNSNVVQVAQTFQQCGTLHMEHGHVVPGEEPHDGVVDVRILVGELIPKVDNTASMSNLAKELRR